jgi:hypothetical protein
MMVGELCHCCGQDIHRPHCPVCDAKHSTAVPGGCETCVAESRKKTIIEHNRRFNAGIGPDAQAKALRAMFDLSPSEGFVKTMLIDKASRIAQGHPRVIGEPRDDRRSRYIYYIDQAFEELKGAIATGGQVNSIKDIIKFMEGSGISTDVPLLWAMLTHKEITEDE